MRTPDKNENSPPPDSKRISRPAFSSGEMLTVAVSAAKLNCIQEQHGIEIREQSQVLRL